jgi:uncharacterized protein
MISLCFRVWTVAAFLVASVSLAPAQQAPAANEPLMGSQDLLPDVTQVQPEEASLNILVVGDALAGGLGAGMTRMAETQPRIAILNRFKENSGLVRSEVYDWPEAVAKIVAAKPVEAIVVLVGLNDRQEIRDGNVRYVFRSPEWVARYEATIDRLLDAASSNKAKIFWVGMPPMADAVFDADMKFLSDLQRQRVVAKGGEYLELRSVFAAPDGSYIDRGPDDTGADRKLRARDGITFMRQGNNRLGQVVLNAVLAKLDNGATTTPAEAGAVPEAAVESPPAAAQAQGVTIVTEAPSFGQAGLDGEDITFRADTVQMNKPDAISVAQRTAGQTKLPGLRESFVARKGSQAEKLLGAGEITAAPAGRFDDFAAPAPPSP